MRIFLCGLVAVAVLALVMLVLGGIAVVAFKSSEAERDAFNELVRARNRLFSNEIHRELDIIGLAALVETLHRREYVKETSELQTLRDELLELGNARLAILAEVAPLIEQNERLKEGKAGLGDSLAHLATVMWNRDKYLKLKLDNAKLQEAVYRWDGRMNSLAQARGWKRE